MNCDDFLPAIEAGGVLARFKARRHASRCPRCASVYARLSDVKRQWSSDAAPLSRRERHLWTSATATEDAPAPSGRRWIARVGGMAAAAVCVVTFLVVRSMHSDGFQPSGSQQSLPTVAAKVEPPPVVSEVTVTELVPAREFDALSDAVDRLDADLVQLRRDAERLAARQQVAMTLERFGTW